MRVSRVEIGLMLASLLLLGALTYSRNLVWQSELSLWRDGFNKSPHKVRPANNLAKALVEHGRCQQALKVLKIAIEKDPYYAEPHYNMGLCYVREGRLDEALRAFGEVVRIMDVLLKGHYGEIPRLTLLIRSLGYMANIYATRGEYERAIEHFRRAIEYAPMSADLRYNLAITLKKSGRYKEAIEEFEKVLAIKPDDQGARWNIMVLKRLVR